MLRISGYMESYAERVHGHAVTTGLRLTLSHLGRILGVGHDFVICYEQLGDKRIVHILLRSDLHGAAISATATSAVLFLLLQLQKLLFHKSYAERVQSSCSRWSQLCY